MTGNKSAQTVITREYPRKHEPGVTDPFYPMLRREPDGLMPRYRPPPRSLKARCGLGGRLADYQYYNMDQACARGLTLANKQMASVT